MDDGTATIATRGITAVIHGLTTVRQRRGPAFYGIASIRARVSATILEIPVNCSLVSLVLENCDLLQSRYRPMSIPASSGRLINQIISKPRKFYIKIFILLLFSHFFIY